MKTSPLAKSLLLVAILLNVFLIVNFVAVPALRHHLAMTIIETSSSNVTYEDAEYIAKEYYPQL